MGNPKEDESFQEHPKVDDMTDDQLGAIIRESITNSEIRLRQPKEREEIPLEQEVIDGIVSLVTEVWRKKTIEEIYPLAKEVDDVESPRSRTIETQLDRDYLKAINQGKETNREAVDGLKSKIVQYLTPIRVPKLPLGLGSYTTNAMNVLIMMKRAEKPKPPSPYSKYL